MDLFEEPLQENVGFEEPEGRNTVEEVLRLSAERGYTVFHRNREDSNVLSDIVVAHPTSIAMIRTWPYILIMDTTYKTNKYYSGLIVLLDIFINLFSQTFKFYNIFLVNS
ncbi:hypothetical protein M9H77_33963 [Catharanthus roseus]|uniref:Uncharacterized protein n=1 Tax=Catharanthus roseus TaxID=4058 RepID=A0ACB9ZK70_CATRO|nr:hypothetical protein M9H77_33963 [Catharanthus roseus]